MTREGNTLEFSRCRHCKTKIANGRKEVIEKFGMRNNGGYIIVQSWCRECRSSSS